MLEFLDSTSGGIIDESGDIESSLTLDMSGESTPILNNDLKASDLWHGFLDLTKAVLPAFVDSPGARGATPAYAYKVTPDAKPVNLPVVATVPVEDQNGGGSSLVVIGGIILLIFLLKE